MVHYRHWVGLSLRDFINLRDTDKTSKNYGKPYGLSDKQFENELTKALESFDPDVDFKASGFKAQNNYLSNDWTEN